MPENDFEKRVQQKMEELRLPPSAGVWEEVEKRIRKEKKRRRFIVWFFLFGALSLGAAGWWVIDINKKQLPGNNSIVKTTTDKKINEITTGKKEDIKEESGLKDQTVNSPENTNRKKEIQLTNSPVITETGVAHVKKMPLTTQIEKSYKKETNNNSVAIVPARKKASDIQPVIPGNTISDKPAIIQKNNGFDSVTTTNPVANAGINTVIKDAVNTDKNSQPADLAVTKQETIPVSKDSLITKQTAQDFKKDTAKTKKNKWEFGITGMAGISGISNGISLGADKSLNYSNPANASGGSLGTPSTTAAAAPPTNGFSGQLGGYAKRKLGARTGLSVGLNFSSYSTIQQTGQFVDTPRVFSSSVYSSSVQDFYRSGTGTSHKNHYYYLELPFFFHWQINKGVKLPLVFQNGLLAGFFMGSDALVYNSTSNVFYKDNKSFYKMQLAYQSGLYAKLFNRSKNPLTAGILFDYHFSKLQKVNTNGGNHLTSFGVQLGWLLKK